MQQIVKQFHLSLSFGVVGTHLPEGLSSGCFTLSRVGRCGERALLLHLIELLDELLEASRTNLLEGLLESVSSDLLWDVKLSFKELLKLI